MFATLPFERFGGRIREHLIRAIQDARRQMGGPAGPGKMRIVE
jgi:hypothetical protein